MDWKLASGTFLTIFVAEMGDKTQLAAFALASGGSKWSVFIAASLALVATTAIAVLMGAAVGRYVPEMWLRRGAGVLFVAMGVLMLIAKPSADEANDSASTEQIEDN